MMISVKLYLQAGRGIKMDKGMVGILIKPPWSLEFADKFWCSDTPFLALCWILFDSAACGWLKQHHEARNVG